MILTLLFYSFYDNIIVCLYLKIQKGVNFNFMNHMNTNHRRRNQTTSFPQDSSYQKIKPEPTDTLVYAMGGLGEVGKNMYCFEHENEILIIDSGVLFPGDSLPGIDYVIPDYSYLVRNNKKRKILIITHGHEDHIGGIPFLIRSVQIDTIYAPAFALALIRKKLDEKRLNGTVQLSEINDRSSVKTQYFTCGFFNTTHSIPDSLGVLINTPNGRAVHTGDFKFDLTPVGSNSDYQVMAYMGQIGVHLLMSDSTNSGIEDFSISERKVASEILETMRRTKGRMIVATFASNVYRVAQILEAAVACGRKIIIFGRSMENVVQIGRENGKIKIGKEHFLKPDQLSYTPAEKTCIVCTGSQGEPLAALSRIAAGTHRYIRIIPGDTVIFSSSPIPGNALSVNKVVNRLFKAGAIVLTKSILSNLHTTGHASQEEQKLMLQLIKPDYFMPIHGEYKMLKQHKETAIETGMDPDHIFTCANGDVLILRDQKVFEANFRVQADDIYVDGNDISGLSTAVLKDRMILADNGLVAAIIAIDSKENKVLAKPVITSRGFVYIKDSQGLLKEAEIRLYNALVEKMKERTTFSELKNLVRSTLEPYLYAKTHRNPIVIPVIINSKTAMIAMQNNRKQNNRRTQKR